MEEGMWWILLNDIDRYSSEAKCIRQGIESDVSKCLSDGKATIVEGFHLDPSTSRTFMLTQECDCCILC
jgi:2-phosphoglycerate kinase